MNIPEASEVMLFFKTCKPFDLLPEEDLARLVGQVTVTEYPAETLIYRQGHSPLNELSVIYAGEVEKYFLNKNGKREFVESFEPGDTFGAISIMLNNYRAIRAVRTLSHTILLQFPRQVFLDLCKQSRPFADFFNQLFGRRMLNHGYAHHLLKKSQEIPVFDAIDIAFQQKIEDWIIEQPNVCAPVVSIREAAKSMVYYRQNYVLVKEVEGGYIGIVTDKDFWNKVIIDGIDPFGPVSLIMNSPIPVIDASTYSYEAILYMFKLNREFLLVTSGGKIKGLVSLEQLLYSQARSPFIFIRSLTLEQSLLQLQDKWRQVPGMVAGLIDRGMRPEIVNPIVSGIADAIAQNLIRQAIDELGPAPVRFAYMVLGSEGRKEQTLSTDQDNAIIFEDVAPDREAEIAEYFVRLGKKVSDSLNQVGFHYCKGDLMASNPKWTVALQTWKDYYLSWIRQPHPENVVISITFFDCRAVYGDQDLVSELKSFIFHELEQNSRLFFAQLAKTSLEIKPPLTFFGNIQLTEKPDKVRGIDFKLAMLPIVDFARIFALKQQIDLGNTGERLSSLLEKGILTEEEFTELHQSYYFLMRLRLTYQTHRLMQGDTPDNIIDLKWFSKIERVTLKEIFKVVERYQKKLHLHFVAGLS